MHKRLSDQTLILKAIADVKKELVPGLNRIETCSIMVRLGTLYSLLDVDMLAKFTEQHDTRNKSAANDKRTA